MIKGYTKEKKKVQLLAKLLANGFSKFHNAFIECT